jgi:hypothetical protein
LRDVAPAIRIYEKRRKDHTARSSVKRRRFASKDQRDPAEELEKLAEVAAHKVKRSKAYDLFRSNLPL